MNTFALSLAHRQTIQCTHAYTYLHMTYTSSTSRATLTSSLASSSADHPHQCEYILLYSYYTHICILTYNTYMPASRLISASPLWDHPLQCTHTYTDSLMYLSLRTTYMYLHLGLYLHFLCETIRRNVHIHLYIYTCMHLYVQHIFT